MKQIALCASVNFYKHAIQVATELEQMGYKVILPSGAAKMRQSGDFEVKSNKPWYENPADFYLKADLMHKHFTSIEASDEVLVVNDEKHGLNGYIGPNVIMEMGMAFYLKKPIYILNDVSKDMPTYEEAMGVMPVMLKGRLENLMRKGTA